VELNHTIGVLKDVVLILNPMNGIAFLSLSFALMLCLVIAKLQSAIIHLVVVSFNQKLEQDAMIIILALSVINVSMVLAQDLQEFVLNLPICAELLLAMPLLVVVSRPS
jgi:hypothetical protein